MIDLEAALGEFGDKPTQGEVPYTFALELIVTSAHDGTALQAKTCGFPATGDFANRCSSCKKLALFCKKGSVTQSRVVILFDSLFGKFTFVRWRNLKSKQR
jgi:hypothetical protein